MENRKVLNIKGTVLDNNSLKDFMKKTAASYEIKNYSSISTYPIDRLNENYIFIEKTYRLLNEHIKKGIDIHSAGEWLLDNFYIIEETVKKIKKEMPIKKYRQLPGISGGTYNGFARVYFLASLIVSFRDSIIDDETLKLAISAYQEQKTLNMEEIWNLWIFLEIAIIENIRGVCEKIYASQMQKYRVEEIIERVIEKRQHNGIKSIKFNTYNLKNEIKYPFIEYMSYKLKRLGRKGIAYLNVLENEVNKLGLSIDDAIKKEHFDIAMQKVLIGNSITSIREISRINFLMLFEKINGVEEILKKDPAKIYNKMDYKTKTKYRNTIKEISKKTKISENYISNKVLELCKQKKEEKAHVGYYLIDVGYNELIKTLGFNRKFLHASNKTKINRYINAVYIITAFLVLIFGTWLIQKNNNIISSIIITAISVIPISEIWIQILNYILVKTVKTSIIPKMDFSNGIPEEYSTFVVIPTIINSPEKVKELMHKLEVYYLANKSDNLYFALLGDCTTSKNEKESIDEKIIKEGLKFTKYLNEKYAKNDKNKFFFLYRNRTWNSGEKNFLGWERKRGLLCQFNDFLINGDNSFRINTIEDTNLKIKYVITLDADTTLCLDTAKQLVGAMAHILNKPKIENRVVIKGHAVLQPRIGIDLESNRKTTFSKIFSGEGGTDLYANAISDVYQDNFGEGIFTGKGIYDLEVFSKILKREIPENTVLSHDLLEGCYLRAGLASDIFLMDGCPAKYNSYMLRLHRWTRGDFQLINWLNKTIITKDGAKTLNPLSKLSKFKILDNLRRSFIPAFALLLILIGLFLKKPVILGLGLICIIFPSLLDIGNYIIFKKNETNVAYRNIIKTISNLTASIIRGFLEFAFLPNKVVINIDAIIRSLYRLKVSKNYLLEWTTSEEAEKQAATSIKCYYKNMTGNWLLGAICIIIGIVYGKLITLIVGTIWTIAPIIACKISKETTNSQILLKEDREYLNKIGEKTWKFFKDNINEKNNFLPPDNYQEDRKEKIAHRTSPTNIGLGLLATISACDLGYITEDEAIELIEKMLHTIEKLPKWNGHLYNWYNTINLEPLIPRYISTVDSGNLVGYLFVLKQFLIEKQKKQNLITKIDKLIENTNFKVLYDYKKRIFSIGFNIEENQLTDSYYDLLASEARQASLVAIAKRDVPSKHWNALSRTLTSLNGYKGLISWSGTAFEYLMPSVNIKTYEGSLLDESCRFMIMSQKQYAKKLGTPWGVSEAAFSLKDLNNNYQYKAFGIPWLGLKRGLDEDIVISSYSVFLSLIYDAASSLKNIRELEKEGMVAKYGFYESIDYTVSRLNANEKKRIVKTYMAHHQGLILLSINNFINNNVLVKRFSSNPEIEAVDILLQERMPKKAIVTKEKKEKIEKLKMKDYQNYVETVFTKPILGLKRANAISNGVYTICNLTDGTGFSKYKNILVNRFKETADYKQGNFFYVRKLSNNQFFSASLEQTQTGKIVFAPDVTQIVKRVQNLELKTLNTVSPDEPIEIKRLEITNNGEQEETLEIINYFEPILCTPMQEYSHPAFNNLFLTYEKEDSGEIIVKRKKRGNNEDNIFLGVNLITESKTIGALEFEIDKEKFMGQGNIDVPNMITQNKPFSNSLELVTESILATKRIIKIGPKQKAQIDLILCVSEDKNKVKEMLKIYNNTNAISKIFELSRAKIEAESIYLGLKGRDIEKYQKMLSFLLFQNPIKSLEKIIPKKVYSQNDLWKFGISGDLPILLVRIKDTNEKYILKDVLKAYDFYRSMNIEVELVILNREINSYENTLENEINKEIQNKQIMFLKNCYGGIFVINENEIKNEDINLLEFRANLIIDGNRGGLDTQLKDLEEEYIKNTNNIVSNNIGEDTDKEMLYQDYTNLKYYNEYGGFTEDGLEYKFRVSQENKLPTVWSMILANSDFGTVVTQNLGGFTWSKNSRLNRVSSWNNTASQDIPSEIIYLEDLDNFKNWSLSQNLSKNQEYHLSYGFGYINLKTIKDEILQELTQFIPLEDSIKINLLKFKNTSNKSKNLNIYYYIKPVLGEDESNTSGYINVEKNENTIFATNMYKNELKDEKVFLTSSENIVKYTGNKQEFIGEFNLQNPKKILSNDSGLYKQSCIAMQISLKIEPYETKEFTLCLGVKEKDKKMPMELANVEKSKEELNKTQKFWYKLLGKVHVNTPIESINIMLNGWGGYQSITSRLWAKSGYYQSGGAIGFRDQIQDTLGIKYLDAKFMKNQILINAKHQFIEGDVEHWWHEETKRGIRTRFSDDLLWLPYVTCEYIEFTGDYSILGVELPYLKGQTLEEGMDEKYDKYEESDIKESLYNHCIKAIEKSLSFGGNGLPKIGSGDWNDGMNTVGNKEKGESVWLGFFLYNVLDRFIDICRYKQDIEKIEKYEKIKNNLKKALNKNGWDGRWFKRAYTDEGVPIGSIENEECRIDSISQSWGVISGAAENTKQYMSMENLENNLIDKENGLIKLLDPPFENSKIEPGYIKAYLPGVRENGGQYTHAAIWVISAFAKLGYGDKAVDYFTMINPIEHSKTKEASKKYKVEPYVIPADIYEAKGLEGRGGWTWYTGSASWFCKVGLEDILGLNIEKEVLRIKPCISRDWKEYSIRYKFGNTIYNIKVKNPNGKNTGVEKLILNGQEVPEKEIKLVDDGGLNEIEVIM